MSVFELTTRSIEEQLDALATINRDPAAGGITREVFTDEYTQANDHVAGLMRSAGLEVRADAFGNLFGRLPGRDPGLPAVLTGSHIDTTLNAGRYDGVLGVIGAIEALRALQDAGWEPQRSVEVVAFAGEEPRFGSGCLGSRALTGDLTRSELDTMRDRDGISVADAMRAVGLDPDRVGEVRLDITSVHAFVELHIEQGSVLEAAEIPIGVVTGIAAPHDLLVTVHGEAAHAGATPMTMRHDAFAAAAEGAVLLERLAQTSTSGSTVATIGVVNVRPGAINVIPAGAELHVDIRDHDLPARTAVLDAFRAGLEEIASRRGVKIEVETIRYDKPAASARRIVLAARAACEELGEPYLDVISGAYHDAMVLSPHVPIGMIFVPSVGGISHSPLEYTAPEDLDRGVRVLAGTLRQLAADAGQ